MIKYTKVIIAVFGVLFSGMLFAQSTNDITVKELKEHVYFLASDSLVGRKPGTPGGKIAAEYIRDQFIENGLTPMGEDGFQYFTVTTSVEPGKNNKIEFNGVEAIADVDFKPMPFTSNAELEANVVFAGYGMEIDHDSLVWNDYEGLDVDGRWVMVLIGDPEPDNDTSLFISYSGTRDKALTTRDKKAGGIIFVSGINISKDDELLANTFNRVTASAGIPAINITRALADSILGGKKSIAQIEKDIIDSKKSIGFSVPATLYVSTELERVEVETQNIVAVIEGNDTELKNEYIVIGAHYDHLGMGGQGSGSRMPDTIAVHNGADDNASGVAAIIELAEKLNSEKSNLRRSIIFIAFGAEEMGLLGSQFFTSDSVIAMGDIVAMLNFDMIGRMDSTKRTLMIGGTGTAEQMEAILTEYEEGVNINFSHSPEGYGASDHSSFYGSRVPVLFFFTGAHQDYHTPLDDADMINYESEKEIIDFTYPIIMNLATRDDKLVYKEAGPSKQTARSGRGLKVKLGIMPDFTSTANDGLGVGGVTAGGPAYIAGMLKGDKIVAIEGMPITNIYDYMARLKKLKPGQRVSVDIIRNGEPHIMMVLL
ncbi:MAG: M20/M25/M40 family metallo-hydrolase [Bacteroidetes bacterium]|nr:M20/M25/M40 family metallo-hydrolase [Bacteroidota bacterium]MBL6943689.1 M20/M25/M40 family metallo-hydrolase [Bacteroidales bacterium]